MYEGLVKRLRAQADAERYFVGEDMLYDKAADAIEELSEQFDNMNEENIALYGALPHWIPVAEQLPDVKTYVLILFDTIAGKMQGVCFLYKDDDGHNCWTWLDRLGKNLFDIQPTHWMPLPELPEELTGTDMRGGIRMDDAGNVIDWGITGPPGDAGKTEEGE